MSGNMTLITGTNTAGIRPLFRPEAREFVIDARAPRIADRKPFEVDGIKGSFTANFWDSKKPLKETYQGSIKVEGGYFQVVSGINQSRDSGAFNQATIFLKAEVIEGGVRKKVYFPLFETNDAYRELSKDERNQFASRMAARLAQDDSLYLFSKPGKDARINAKPQPGAAAPKDQVTVTLPTGEKKTFIPSFIRDSSFKVIVPASAGVPAREVKILEFEDGNFRFFAVRQPKTDKLVVIFSAPLKADVALSSMEAKALSVFGVKAQNTYTDTGRTLTVSPNGMGDIKVSIKKASDEKFDYYAVPLPNNAGKMSEPWRYARGTSFQTIAADINLYIRQLYNDFKPLNNARFDTVFNATLDGRASRHQARLGFVQTSDGLRVAAQIADKRDSQGKVTFKIYVLPKQFTSDQMKADPNNPKWRFELAKAAPLELSQMAARGEIKVTGESADLSGLDPVPNREAAIKLSQLQQQQWEGMWLLIDAGLLYTAFGRINAAFKTVRAYEAGSSLLGKAVTQAEYKAAQGYLVSAMVGGAAGQGSYWLFIERKYYVEAIDSLQQGKPFESLSYGAKAAIQFLTWSVGTGSLSGEVAANINIAWGKSLAVNRLGSPKNWLDSVNWGMFVDPTLYTAANVRKVMGTGGEALISKYGAILNFIEANPKAVLNGGKLAIPDEVIRAANIPGVRDNASLAKSFINDGMWRIFNATPIPFTPLKFASTSTLGGTISANTQLVVTRAGIAMGANILFQNLNSLAMNGSAGINWTQVLAAIVGGGTRTTGAPAAWLAPTIKSRLFAYTPPSVVAFLEGVALKGLFQTRKANNPSEFKSDESQNSIRQLQIMGNANQAANAASLLFEALSKNEFASKTDLDLVGQYFAKAAALLGTKGDQLVTQAAALDKWLNAKGPGSTVSRRVQLSSFQLDAVPGLSKNVEIQIESGVSRTSVGTRTFADVGIAPKFSEFIAPK
jgi:hypothetical protein